MVQVKAEWIERVRSVLGSFAQIPEAEWEKAKARFKPLRLKKNEYFIRAGESPDKIACIITGIFRVFYATEAGDERTLAIREEGRMLSAFSAIIDRGASWYDIQALEDSELAYIGLESYEEGLRGHPCWQAINAKYSQMLFMEKERRESELLADDAETRYLKFKERYPGLEDRIRHIHVASYLGITPVALSRIRKRLRESGRH